LPLWLSALGLFGALALPQAVPPPRAELRATMACRSEPGTGRLVCVVELEPPVGHELTWSDALVVSAPARATPLRSRVAGAGRPPRRIVLGFVLGAGAGGRIEVLARAVACPTGERAGACVSSSKRVYVDVE